jgi:hypothetical protein
MKLRVLCAGIYMIYFVKQVIRILGHLVLTFFISVDIPIFGMNTNWFKNCC